MSASILRRAALVAAGNQRRIMELGMRSQVRATSVQTASQGGRSIQKNASEQTVSQTTPEQKVVSASNAGEKSFIEQFNNGEHDSRWSGVIPMKDPAEYKQLVRDYNQKKS